MKDFIYKVNESFGTNVISFISLSGGKNSKVLKIICDNHKEYILKQYFSHTLDQRNRLKVEFDCLKFLHNENISCVPKPLLQNEEYNYAIFEYINGKKIESEDVSFKDIDMLVNFLSKLNVLKLKTEAKKFKAASEACFSIKAIIENIENRVNRLLQVKKNDSEIYELLLDFIHKEFKPCFIEIQQWCFKQELNWKEDISLNERILSPSDYGFHNSLRLSDKIIFVDFEYFGWDDPAKMICDFLIHPAMSLSVDIKKYFFNSILRKINNNSRLEKRVVTVYPLFALKWCMIFLNEFVPELLLRRKFSGNYSDNLVNIQTNQLNKSIKLLKKVMNQYENFPYRK